jgi:hypothetical protein
LYSFYFKVEDYLKNNKEDLNLYLEKIDDFLDLLFVFDISEIKEDRINFDTIENLTKEDITKAKALYILIQNKQLIKKFFDN